MTDRRRALSDARRERKKGKYACAPVKPVSAEAVSALRAAETIGRRLGSASFLDRLAAATGRDPRPRRRGLKPRRSDWGLSKVSP